MEEENKIKNTCWFGLHQYKIYKELDLTDSSNRHVGIVIINRCECCGKVKGIKINTVTYG